MSPARDSVPFRLLNRDGSFNVDRRGRRGQLTDLYHSLLSMSAWRFFGVLVLGFFVVNALFAWGYFLAGDGALDGSKAVTDGERYLEAFFFSVQTLDTIGYGKISPHGLIANGLVTLEAMTGLMGLALATGLLFARFSRPTARVTFSRNAIIADHDGVPSLVFRVANRRLNQIVEAKVNVVLSRMEQTIEGQEFRNFHDLVLERGQSPIFALSWTIVHPITRDSPLHGATPASLRASESEIVASLIGTDDVFSQTVHTRFSYTADEIVWRKAFADMLYRENGKVRMELERIHDVVDLVEDG